MQTATMPSPQHIFISYSHDSTAHKESVLQLANQLREQGLDCQLDQYINGFPPEGWQRWMENQIEQAGYVLIICTPLYLQRFRGLDPEGGRGVNFEGLIISQTLYDHWYRNTRFIPIVFNHEDKNNVPLPLKGYTTYQLPEDHTALYRLLTNQPTSPAPDLGETVTLKIEKPIYKASPSKGKADKTSHTLKAAYITVAGTILAAIIAGLFALYSQPSITTQGDCSGVYTGDINQPLNVDCSTGD
jgi:hypothetical protein